MTKQELEKAIENGESVWCVYKDTSSIYEIKAVEIEKVLNDTFLWGKEYYSNIKDVYKTQSEAEHYLNHANITRTETLPFLTWEELLNQTEIYFYGADGVKYYFYYDEPFNRLVLESTAGSLINEDLTEANFYKAYDECVRLFRGEE